MKKLLLLALLSSSSVFAQTPKSEQIGTWSYSKSIDLISDEDKSFIGVPEVNFKTNNRTYLVIRCAQSALDPYEILVITNDYIGKGPANVIYRFDKKPASNITSWRVSPTGIGLFVSEQVLPDFLKDIEKSTLLTLRIEKYDNSTVTYQFAFLRTADAMKKLPCLQK